MEIERIFELEMMKVTENDDITKFHLLPRFKMQKDDKDRLKRFLIVKFISFPCLEDSGYLCRSSPRAFALCYLRSLSVWLVQQRI